MKITFEENIFKVYDGDKLVKQNKYDDAIVAFLEANPGERDYDESIPQVAKLHKRMDKRAAKAAAKAAGEIPEVKVNTNEETPAAPVSDPVIGLDSASGKDWCCQVVEENGSVHIYKFQE